MLQRVPNSHLLLFAKEGSHRQRVRDHFASRGIDPARIQFIAFLDFDAYFRQYHAIDIVLDPFPYCGGTTTCDALYMGVPVITLAGDRAVGRGGVSLLSTVGLPELIAPTPQEYVTLATTLAHDLPRLASLRQSLRPRMLQSPLMNAPRFAHSIESAFRTMWHDYCTP